MNLTLGSAIIVVLMAIFDLLNLTLWLIWLLSTWPKRLLEKLQKICIHKEQFPS